MIVRMKSIVVGSCLTIVMLFGGNAAWSQSEAKSSTLVATGQHEETLAPQKLRLTLTIQAEGADATTAVRKLAEHKKKVQQELVALKADEGSIQFGATKVSSGTAGLSAEMQHYAPRVFSQFAGQTPGVDAENLPKVSTATTTVRADWPLPTTDFDALALLPEALQEQVKARDLRGEKNKAELDEAQREKLEEMQTAMQEQMGYYGDDDSDSQFGILFVTTIDDEARKKAMKAAYDEALKQAEMLASVTGKELGELVSLRAHDASAATSAAAVYASMYSPYGVPSVAHVAPGEVVAESPDELKLNVRVEAQFNLSP